MAYDRYDERSERGRNPQQRDRSDHDRDDDRGYRGQARRESSDDRGFFERAGDEIASWFGDDESGRRDERSDSRHERDRNRGEDRYRVWGRDDSARYRPEDDRMSHGGERERNRDRGFFRGSSDRGSEARSAARQWPAGSGSDDYRPMTGDYGRSSRDDDRLERDRYRSNYERDPYHRTSEAHSMRPEDRHYQSWRNRQMDELDRDYDDYRREHQSKFESEFGGWREKRQSKRQMLGQVREHMEVVGDDGEHVGTVDKVAGDRIILTKSDPESGGVHHSLGCGEIDGVEDGKVRLDCSADQAKRRWREEGRNRALFERDERGEDGPHILDRSFSGTYRS